MTARLTIDANVLVYALDARHPLKQGGALKVIDACRDKDCAIALQVFSEHYAALTRKLRRAPWEAAQAVRNIMLQFPHFQATSSAVDRALSEAAAGRYGYWDALLLAAAHDAGRAVCFSEDMQDGAVLGAVEVVNPLGPNGLSARAMALLS